MIKVFGQTVMVKWGRNCDNVVEYKGNNELQREDEGEDINNGMEK
jgi:hypothetical protein